MADQKNRTGPKPIFINDIATPVGRISFPHLAEPDTKGKYADDKFKATLLFPKQGVDLSILRNAALSCAQQAFGAGIKTLNDFQHPFRDGDAKTDLAGYAGNIFITAKSKKRPLCIDRTKQNINPDEIYGGCYARMIVTACSYQSTENVKDPKTGQVVKQVINGVTFLLDGVQKTKDGEAFGGGGATAESFPDDLPAEDGFQAGAGPEEVGAPTQADAEAMFR
jgi:hypothetical protein